ncbi:hypothetical protein BD769DRAFT_1384751 [Suillus cothurnatus]|nr:hypothetical protein BD769DRAFT_1384751 [Suillus cothurnatus]
MRWLFPVILILSADYEEQCMMSLIRGVQCKRPCPMCLVPLNELSDLSKTFTIRTAKDMQDALIVYRRSKTQGKELLKSLGLRTVENVLWLVKHSNPHDALSLDRLHTVHGGLGGKHLLEELKTIISNLGREEMESQSFYVALNALDRRSCLEGYRLLHVICSYLELDSLLGLDVHMEWTIAMIEDELLVFGAALKDYVDYITDTSSMEGLKKDWNFPKAHLWKHALWDIQMKGVACNYSMRPNEKLHGPLKTAYLLQLNGKDVAVQVLCVDHHKFATLLLRGRLDTLDERHCLEALGDSALDEDNDHAINFDGHVKLGSPQRPLMRWIVLPVDFQIHEHRYLRVNYENSVDWKQSTNHLRSNPSFHGHLRFDCALIQLTADRMVFVRLILMFKCELPDIGAFQFALVQLYTAGVIGIMGALISFHAAVSTERSNIVHAIKSCAGIIFASLKLNPTLFSSQTDAQNLDNPDLLCLLKKNGEGEYIWLAPILFAKPDAMVADKFLKNPVLVQIVCVEIYGKKILSRKTKGQKARGQHCNAQCVTEGLIVGAAVMACFLMMHDPEFTVTDDLLDKLDAPTQVTSALTSIPATLAVVDIVSNYHTSLSVNQGQSASATAQLQLGVSRLTLDNTIEPAASAPHSVSSCQPQAHATASELTYAPEPTNTPECEVEAPKRVTRHGGSSKAVAKPRGRGRGKH